MIHVKAIAELTDSDQPGPAKRPKSWRTLAAEHQSDDSECEHVDRQERESRCLWRDERRQTTSCGERGQISQGSRAEGNEDDLPPRRRAPDGTPLVNGRAASKAPRSVRLPVQAESPKKSRPSSP